LSFNTQKGGGGKQTKQTKNAVIFTLYYQQPINLPVIFMSKIFHISCFEKKRKLQLKTLLGFIITLPPISTTRYFELSGMEQRYFLTPSILSVDETYTSTVRHSTLAASGSSAIAS
jgi:hypothetical protein